MTDHIWNTLKVGSQRAKLFAEHVLIPCGGGIDNPSLYSRPDELLNNAIATTKLGASNEWADLFAVMGYHGGQERQLVLLPSTHDRLNMQECHHPATTTAHPATTPPPPHPPPSVSSVVFVRFGVRLSFHHGSVVGVAWAVRKECIDYVSKDWSQRAPSSLLAYFLQLDDKISSICVEGSNYYHFDSHARATGDEGALAADRCLLVSGKLYRDEGVQLNSFIGEVMCRGRKTSAYKPTSRGTVWALIPKEHEPALVPQSVPIPNEQNHPPAMPTPSQATASSVAPQNIPPSPAAGSNPVSAQAKVVAVAVLSVEDAPGTVPSIAEGGPSIIPCVGEGTDHATAGALAGDAIAAAPAAASYNSAKTSSADATLEARRDGGPIDKMSIATSSHNDWAAAHSRSRTKGERKKRRLDHQPSVTCSRRWPEGDPHCDRCQHFFPAGWLSNSSHYFRTLLLFFRAPLCYLSPSLTYSLTRSLTPLSSSPSLSLHLPNLGWFDYWIRKEGSKYVAAHPKPTAHHLAAPSSEAPAIAFEPNGVSSVLLYLETPDLQAAAVGGSLQSVPAPAVGDDGVPLDVLSDAYALEAVVGEGSLQLAPGPLDGAGGSLSDLSSEAPALVSKAGEGSLQLAPVVPAAQESGTKHRAKQVQRALRRSLDMGGGKIYGLFVATIFALAMFTPTLGICIWIASWK